MNKKISLTLLLTLLMTLISYTLLKAEDKEQTDTEFHRKLENLVAEEIKDKAKEEEKKEEMAHELDVYGRYLPSCDAQSQSGKVGLIDAGAEYTYKFKAFGKLPIELSLEKEYVGIENSTAVPLPPHLIGISAGVETTLPFFFDKTYFRLGVYPSYYGQDYNFSSSAFRIPSYYLWIHQPNDKLTLIAGVGVFPDFETEVLPIFGLIYKPDDKWFFNLTPKRPAIYYSLNDKTTLFGEGGYRYGEYEVERDGVKNRVLEYKYAYAGGGIKYTFNKFIESFLSAGYAFNRGLKYRDDIGKLNIESGLYTEFRLEMRI